MSTVYNPSSSFEDAASYLSIVPSLTSPVSNSTKLELYAIYKYFTIAPFPNIPKPSIFDFTGKAKWEAWKSAGETYRDRPEDAEARYLEIARSLGWSEGLRIEPEAPSSKGEGGNDGGEDDIWDKEDEIKKYKSDRAMGHMMSTLNIEHEGSGNAVSDFAIAGDVEGLLEYLEGHPGMDINSRDKNGYTALHLAADRGHSEFVKALLARGADKEVKDEDEFTAKELAEVAGHSEIANLLAGTSNTPS